MQDLLDEIWGKATTGVGESAFNAVTDGSAVTDGRISPFQFAKKIEHAMDEEIRPMLQRDGGDVEIVDIKDAVVYCSLKGACVGCAGASATLKMLVEQTLKNVVDDRIRVIQI